MNDPSASHLRFGVYDLDLKTSELRKAGMLINLPPQPFKILALLASHAGELVTREELRHRIWGDGTFVDFEKGLNFAIRKIRSALGDDAEVPRYIETLPRRGYRFITPVETVPAYRASSPPPRGGPAVVSIAERMDGPQVKLPSRSRSADASAQVVELAETPETSQLSLAEPVRRNFERRRRIWWPLVVVGILVPLGIVLAVWLIFWKPSVAVSAFKMDLNDQNQKYVAEEMHDGLIRELVKFKKFPIIAPADDGTLPPGIDKVIEGTVKSSQKAGHIRIEISLRRFKSGQVLWQEAYDPQMSELPALQGKVAESIARECGVTITPQERERLSKYQPDPDAYQAYLEAQYEWRNRIGPANLLKSTELFKKAVRNDPGYVLASAWLSQVYVSYPDYNLGNPRKSCALAKDAVMKAIGRDDTPAEAYTALANIEEECDHDWRSAEIHFKKAIEISPNSTTAHQWYSEYLLRNEQKEDALKEIRQAQRLEPSSPILNAEVGGTLYWMGRDDDAIKQLNKTIQMGYKSQYAFSWLGFAYAHKGMLNEAVKSFRSAVRMSADEDEDKDEGGLSPVENILSQLKNTCDAMEPENKIQKAAKLPGGDPYFWAGLGFAYGRLGKTCQARQILDRLEASEKERYVSPYAVALGYAGLGRDGREKALTWLDKADVVGDPGLDLLRVEPALDILRSEPRFTKLVQKVFPPIRAY